MYLMEQLEDKLKIDWIAVDDAYNDFAIAGVWSNTSSSANVSHGIKARMSIRGHEQHPAGGSEQGSADETVEEATGFLMGVR